jgi:ubiquitin carboxyl-terminal hydrolase 9/24
VRVLFISLSLTDLDTSNQANEDGALLFPVDELQRLDEMINRPRWLVPVLPKQELEILLDAAIQLSKQELDTKCEHCQRFIRDGLMVSFTKILTDEAVNSWKYDIYVIGFNLNKKITCGYLNYLFLI